MFRVALSKVGIARIGGLLRILPSVTAVRRSVAPSARALGSKIQLRQVKGLEVLGLISADSTTSKAVVGLTTGSHPTGCMFTPTMMQKRACPSFFVSMAPTDVKAKGMKLFHKTGIRVRCSKCVYSRVT